MVQERISGMLKTSATGRGLLLGAFVIPFVTDAPTDTTGVQNGKAVARVSGSDIVLHVFSAELGAWKSVTLS